VGKESWRAVGVTALQLSLPTAKAFGERAQGLSPRERELELPQTEALARQTDVLHHLFQILICLREMIMHRHGCML
jgi:hypothetical protein